MHMALSILCFQAYLCQQSPLELMKPISSSWIDELRSIKKLEKAFCIQDTNIPNIQPRKSTQAYIHITYAYAPPIINNMI